MSNEASTQGVAYRASGLVLAGRAIEFVALFTIAGYISFRAEANHLGIPSPGSLGSERYLKETYTLLISVVLPLAQYLLLAVLVGALFLRIGARRWPLATQRLRRFGVQVATASQLPTLLLCLLVAESFALVWGVLGRGIDVTVGPLSIDWLEYLPPWILYFAIIFNVAIFVAYLAAIARVRADPALQTIPMMWRLVASALLVVTLQIPMAYGAGFKRAFFPLAMLSTNNPSNPPLCALLIAESSDALTLWRSVQHPGPELHHHGQIVVIPKSTLSNSMIGQLVDLLDAAHESVRASKPAPDCSGL